MQNNKMQYQEFFTCICSYERGNLSYYKSKRHQILNKDCLPYAKQFYFILRVLSIHLECADLSNYESQSCQILH